MFLKAAASIILCVSMFFGTIPSYPDVDRKADLAAASFNEYEITLADGGLVTVKLSGGSVVFESDAKRDYTVTLYKASNSKKVKNYSQNQQAFEIEMASAMNEDELYYFFISYEAFDLTITNGNNLIFKKGSKLYFWKSVNYDYNVGTTSEMWTDEKSLQECLKPQNDVECDDPVLISYSNQICDGAKDDWEKVFRIYMYISSEMAYDRVEANGDAGGYQDGAVAVMRDGKSICEGFGNVFAALCRAQGIPAVVEFGIGFAGYEEMMERVPTNEDYADHAWAAVYLGDRWHFVDPTYDMARYYEGPGKIKQYEITTLYYLLPLESFSNDHRIMDADTIHGIESAGYCGDNATYEITRDGVCYIKGEGTIKMPPGVNGFSRVVFDPDSNITVIGSECFCDCDLITVIILPETVTRIESLAFNTCEDLEYVYLPESLEYIGQEAFECCDELSYIRVPDSVDSMGPWAFDDDPRLYISIPSHLEGFDDDYELEPMYIEYR